MNKKRKTGYFEYELPEGYKEELTLDIKDKRFALRLNIAAFIVMLVSIAVSMVILLKDAAVIELDLIAAAAMPIAVVAYIVLHELLHGLAYKLLTGQKLEFGMTCGAAYCGVPGVYVYRHTSIIALLAPFVVFGTAFIALTCFLPSLFHRILAATLLALHLGGCMGDLYLFFLFMTRFKDKRALSCDNGSACTFYLPRRENEEK